jgi:AcrR family transcriptional regulator
MWSRFVILERRATRSDAARIDRQHAKGRAMPRKTRSEMQAATREKLLESARAAFGRKGFASATIDEIAEGAGFSRGAFYSNFSTKEDLAVELMGQQMELDVNRIVQLMVSANGPADSLPERLQKAFPPTDRITDWELLRLEMLMLAQRNPDFAAKCQALYQPQRERAALAIQQLFGRIGREPPVDTELLVQLIMSLRHGAALLHEAMGPIRLGQIVEMIFRALAAAGKPTRRDASEAA